MNETVLPNLEILSIGRGVENNIILVQKDISTIHAKLVICSPSTFILIDSESKNGTFVNDLRISRKLIDIEDSVSFASNTYVLKNILPVVQTTQRTQTKKDSLDFTEEFQKLSSVQEEYENLKLACRSKEKSIKLWSTISASLLGVGSLAAAMGTGGLSTLVTTGVVAASGSVTALSVLSSMGLGMLIPSIASEVLSTDEKLRLLDKELRQIYRCPNSDCQDPFGIREWVILAKQKSCKKCKAIWVK